MPTVIICDDHTVVRSGLRLILEHGPDFTIVGEAADGPTAIALAGRLRPDIVITDLSMPGLSGLEAIPAILRAAPQTRVLVLTIHDEDGYFFQALQAGASGYLLKGASAEELLAALRTISEGGVPMPPKLSRRLLVEYRERASAAPLDQDPLSAREREVLDLIAAGHTNREIAERLLVSVRTVERLRTNIMSKAGLHSHAELMNYAFQHGRRAGPPAA